VPQLPDCTTVSADRLLEAVGALRADDWRLVTASCVPHRAGWTVLYHFERGETLRHLRLEVPAGGSAPSIASRYGAAFLVENEMAELQGLPVSDLVIDYRGRLYRDFDGPEGAVHGPYGEAMSALEAAGLTRLDACVPVVDGREVRASTTRVPEPPAASTNGHDAAGEARGRR
jgi:hypothetical protein